MESHEKNISGLFEVPSTAIDRLGQPCDQHRVVLKFDNSYSKLRAKNLVYRVHHVSPKTYTDAVEAANVITKKKSEFAHQRQLVKAGKGPTKAERKKRTKEDKDRRMAQNQSGGQPSNPKARRYLTWLRL